MLPSGRCRAVSAAALAVPLLLLLSLPGRCRTADPPPLVPGQVASAAAVGGKGVLAVVGVFSGVGEEYSTRRATLRSTWFPASEEGLAALQSRTGVALRFVVGAVESAAAEAALAAEADTHGALLRLPVLERYANLALKLVRFLEAGLARFPGCGYLMKVDDDVYLVPQQLPPALGQWTAAAADLVGCFMPNKRVSQSRMSKWYEPSHALFGASYHTYPSGPTYAVSSRSAALLVALLHRHRLRLLGCGDDCSVGLWLGALNTTWLDDRRLCAPHCSPAAISVRGESGLGGRRGSTRVAAAMVRKLHAAEACRPGDPSERGGSDSSSGPVLSDLSFELATCARLSTRDGPAALDYTKCREKDAVRRSLYSALTPEQKSLLRRRRAVGGHQRGML
mmetsp:Transcript_33313/g.83914  ORF Transcript_33313/g.83914 Transcript_33313/m.83914 type:complete len:394 (+) Transcript_33313:230-1411(+)